MKGKTRRERKKREKEIERNTITTRTATRGSAETKRARQTPKTR